MRNEDLLKIWEDHWKLSVVEKVKVRYSLLEIEPNLSISSDKLKFLILSSIYNFAVKRRTRYEEDIIMAIRSKELNESDLYTIHYYQDSFSEAFITTLLASINHELYKEWNFAALSTNFSNFSKNHWNHLRDFLKKREGVKLVLFLRRDRRFKGRLCLINSNGEIIKEKSLQALCKGRENKPFLVSNGQTPCGVYEINSVMPKADQQELFGEFRRLKLEFLDRKTIEDDFSEVLLEHHFWKEGVMAKAIGRSLLRIHGTGLVNRNIFKKYHPFVTTSGCVSMCETKSVKGQRMLLDTLMDDLGLEKSFVNEEKIFGTLAVVELNEEKSHVSLNDLEGLI
jgi:hypothetical protein